MSITRDIGLVVQGLVDTQIITCSTADQTGTTGNNVKSTTAASGVNGAIIDRLTDLTQRHPVVYPSAYLWSSRGSTEADRKLTLGLKIQHGASSAGGDMADYSTGEQPVDVTFFTTARTTDMAAWTTGAFRGQSTPAYYDLRGASRYIRQVVWATKDKVTTESSGDEGMHIGGALVFAGAEQLPVTPYTSQGSTSTST